MSDDALFDLPAGGGIPVALPEPMSADRRRTLRQAETIAIGGHPLNLAVPPVTRHPLTIGKTYSRDGAAGRSHTCGTCISRESEQHNSRVYPKCQAEAGIRITGGAGTDVRAWWPACNLWAPE